MNSGSAAHVRAARCCLFISLFCSLIFTSFDTYAQNSGRAGQPTQSSPSPTGAAKDPNAQQQAPPANTAEAEIQLKADQELARTARSSFDLAGGKDDRTRSEESLEDAELRVARDRELLAQFQEADAISAETSELQNVRTAREHAGALRLSTKAKEAAFRDAGAANKAAAQADAEKAESALIEAENDRLKKVNAYQDAHRQRELAHENRLSTQADFLTTRDHIRIGRQARDLDSSDPCPNESKPIETLGIEDPRDARILTIIFNQRTHQLWRYNPANKTETYKPVDRYGYVPSAQSNEPIMLLICGLHFKGVATITPTLVNLPDVSSALYQGAPDISATAAPAPGGGGTPAIAKANGAANMNILSAANLLEREVLTAPVPAPTLKACDSGHQKQIEADITDLKTKLSIFTASVNAFQTSEELHTFRAFRSGAFSTSSVNFDLNRVADEELSASGSVGQFNLAAADLQTASGVASSVATRLVAASKGDSWIAMKTASASLIASINTYRADRDKDSNANDCSPLAIEISAANDTVGDSVQGLQSALADSDETIRELDYLYDRIRHLYGLLNFDYKLSNTKDKHMVDFSTGNALITEQISVADNWTPFADPSFVALPATGPGSAPPAKVDTSAVNKPTPSLVTAAATVGTGAAATSVTLSVPSVSSAVNAGASAPPPAVGDKPMTAATTSTNGGTPAPQTTAAAGQVSTSKAQDSGTAVVQSGQIQSFDAQPSLWRKLLVRFVATGGAFAAHEPTESYTAQQLPTAVITTVMSTVTTTPTSGTPTISTTNESTTTAGTENLPFRSDDTKWHPGAAVGITWFPASMDTYSYGPRSGWRYDSFREDFAHSFRNLGLFLGSTVNTSGTFIFGPAYQVSPGIEVFVGGTLLSSDNLASGVSSCRGLESGLTSNTAPPSTVNDTTVDPTSGTKTSTVTTTTVTTQTHCINADATVLSDTNVPKQTDARVGFSFGILLNSNLFKAFGWTK